MIIAFGKGTLPMFADNKIHPSIICLALMTMLFFAAAQPMNAATPAQGAAAPNQTVRTVGNFKIEMRVPVDGLYAEEETDIEFHVSDTTQDDPVLGAAPIVNAKVIASIMMPAMPSMPQQEPKIHQEGVPGDYGVVAYFPHGGDYHLTLTVTPPGAKPLTVTFLLSVEDAAARKGKPAQHKPYTLEVTPSVPPQAGIATTLTIIVRSRTTGQPVTEFDTTHTKKIHFIVVSKDLAYFSHEHPELGADGSWTLPYTFPTGGEYRLFADTAPHGAGSQVVMQPMIVGGSAGSPGPPSVKLAPTSTIAPTDGVQVRMQTNAQTLTSGKMLPLTFDLTDAQTNLPITDLEPYLGAMAHLILVEQDAATFVHCHPDETDPMNGHKGSLTFNVRFPKAGVYKGWIQFQRAGKVSTAAFVVRATAKGGVK